MDANYSETKQSETKRNVSRSEEAKLNSGDLRIASLVSRAHPCAFIFIRSTLSERSRIARRNTRTEMCPERSLVKFRARRSLIDVKAPREDVPVRSAKGRQQGFGVAVIDLRQSPCAARSWTFQRIAEDMFDCALRPLRDSACGDVQGWPTRQVEPQSSPPLRRARGRASAATEANRQSTSRCCVCDARARRTGTPVVVGFTIF